FFSMTLYEALYLKSWDFLVDNQLVTTLIPNRVSVSTFSILFPLIILLLELPKIFAYLLGTDATPPFTSWDAIIIYGEFGIDFAVFDNPPFLKTLFFISTLLEARIRIPEDTRFFIFLFSPLKSKKTSLISTSFIPTKEIKGLSSSLNLSHCNIGLIILPLPINVIFDLISIVLSIK